MNTPRNEKQVIVHQGWEPALMLRSWHALTPAEQARAIMVAHREGLGAAGQIFGRESERSALDQPVGYNDYHDRFVRHAPDGDRASWSRQPLLQRRSDPRVCHFVAALERERRRLVGESALPDDPQLLRRSANVSRNLADTLCATMIAEAELQEMIALAAAAGAGDGPVPAGAH